MHKTHVQQGPEAEHARDAYAQAWGLHHTLRVAVDFMEKLATPVSLGAAMRIRYGEFDQLVRMEVNPRDYQHAATYDRDYTAVSYLSKLKGLVPEADLEEVALRGFTASEDRCASTNLRFSNGRPIPGAEAILYRMRKKIAWLLRDFDIDEIVGLCRWGPGATATLKSGLVRPENKICESRISVTRSLYKMAQAVVGRDLHWARARLGPEVEGPCTLLFTEFRWVDYMRVVTVDKNSKTKRTIGAEPTFNTYFQQGIGRALRKRLKSVGIDLDDQGRNQYLASMAQKLGLCTVDKKSASDLICYRLVEEVIPPCWFRVMCMSRSGFAKLPNQKRPIPLEKFSSMGNGFTFELETILFWAAASAVCEELELSKVHLSVYGDDVILPAAAYDRYCEVARLLGWQINETKSFKDGSFFESCGEHFFDGIKVTPIYQKEMLDELPQLVRAANRLDRWAATVDSLGRELVDVQHPIRTCRAIAAVDHPKLPAVPHGTVGDEGFWVKHPAGYYDPNRGYLCRIVVPLSAKVDTNSYEALLAITFARSRAPRPQTAVDKGFKELKLDVSVKARGYLRSRGVVSDTPCFEGVVTLRGSSGYRIARRWIHRPA